MTDLTTLLSFFLKDLYAGTLGTTAPITGILVGSGSASAPSYSFSGDPDTGIANLSANQVDLCVGGSSRFNVNSSNTSSTGSYVTAAGSAYFWTGRSILQSPADGVVQVTNQAQSGFTRAIFGTNDNGAGGFGLVNNGGGLDVKSGDGTAFRNISVAGLTTSTTAVIGTKISSYNAVATAGWGVPAVQAQAITSSQVNTGNTSIASYANGAATGVFRVSADVSITSGTNFSFSIDVTYTDDAANARTLVLPMYATTGAQLATNLMTNTVGTGAFTSAVMEIRADPSTTITVRTSAGGTFTTVTYTAAATITQVG